MNTAERQQFAQHLGALNCFAGVNLNLPYEEAIHTLECIQATLLTLQRINDSHLSEMHRRINISSQEDIDDEDDVSVVTTSEFGTECDLDEISDDDDSSYVIEVIDESTITEVNDNTVASALQVMKPSEMEQIESEMMAPLAMADLTLDAGHNVVYEEDDVMEPLTLDDLTPNENYVPENDNYAEHYTIHPTQEYGVYWKEELHPNVTVRANKHRQIVSKYL